MWMHECGSIAFLVFSSLCSSLKLMFSIGLGPAEVLEKDQNIKTRTKKCVDTITKEE